VHQGRLRRGLAGSPGILRIAAAVAVVAALIVAIVGATAVAGRASALQDAQAASAQLVRVQTIRTALVQADADATNSFLVGGLEPTDQRADYVASISLASKTLTEASESSEAYATALGEVNDSLSTYTGLIEAARANNRQGYPVGAAYLKNASNLLRTDILPLLGAASDAATEQFDDAIAASNAAGIRLAIGVLAGLALLIGAQVVLAGRTRRMLSVPVAFATVVLVLAGAVAFATMGWADSTADDIRADQYAVTKALTQARAEAFDAKSNESLTLISRGSGATYEEAWQDSMGRADGVLERAGLPGDIAERLGDYRAVHEQIRTLDDGGDWDGAVALATGPDEGGANAAFAAFDDRSGDQLSASAGEIDDGLGGTETWLNTVGLLVLAAGLVAAVAAWWGFSIRLDDYR
jgi:hypothetical protein